MLHPRRGLVNGEEVADTVDSAAAARRRKNNSNRGSRSSLMMLGGLQVANGCLLPGNHCCRAGVGIGSEGLLLA